MPRIEETRLPGVGVRHDFVTQAGARIGVISRRDGGQDVLVFDENDPDRCAQTLRLEAQDSRALAELLGASPVPTALGEDLLRAADGITVESWAIEPSSLADGRTIAETALRRRTGASIAAVLRGGATLPAQAGTHLRGGDIVVLVGTRADVSRALELLRGR